MGDTPRTDAKWSCVGMVSDPADVMADFARQLERELAEARECLRYIISQLMITGDRAIATVFWRLDAVDDETVERWRKAAGLEETK